LCKKKEKKESLSGGIYVILCVCVENRPWRQKPCRSGPVTYLFAIHWLRVAND